MKKLKNTKVTVSYNEKAEAKKVIGEKYPWKRKFYSINILIIIVIIT